MGNLKKERIICCFANATYHKSGKTRANNCEKCKGII